MPPVCSEPRYDRARQKMKLYELAYACRLYQGQFDGGYREMRIALGDDPDLDSVEKRQDLMEFLNKWGCRIRRNDFDDMKSRLEKWVRDPEGFVKLPKANEEILSLGPSTFEQIGRAFDA
jgi:hypothetical protein